MVKKIVNAVTYWPLLVAAASPAAANEIGESRLLVTNEYFTFGAPSYITAAVALADMDGDGDLDAVNINGRHWARQDIVLWNNGFGRFLSGTALGADLATGYKSAVTDLNGDGLPDLVVARDRLPGRIFINQGDGSFEDGGPVGPSGPTRSVSALDLDGDGATDLVFSLRGQRNEVLFGPDFVRAWRFEEAEQTVRSAIGDLNEDGYPDVVFANLGPEGNIIHFNDGTGHFKESRRLDPKYGQSVDVAIGDVNHDGMPDIVFASVGINTVFLNDKDHRFSSSLAFGLQSERSYGIAIGDLDDDGLADIAVANAGAPNAVYMNRLDALWRVELQEDQDALSYDVSMGDLDNNGYLDLVFGNSGSMSRAYLNVSRDEADSALKR